MSVLYSPTLKYPGHCTKMDSRNGHPQQQRYQQQNSGLSRYRSAPSSLLTSFVESSHGGVGLDHQHQQNQYGASLGSEMEAMLARLVSSSNNGWSSGNVKQEEEEEEEAGDSVFCHGGPESDQIMYHSQELQAFPNGSCSGLVMSNMGLQNSNQSKMGSGNCSNLLIRQKSSPAGFFSNFSVRNGFAAMGEQATTSTRGLNGGLTFSSRPSSSCPRRMPQIAENGNETLEAEEQATTCAESRNPRNDNGSNRSYIPSFPSDLWESSSFTAQQTPSNNTEFVFSTSNALESQHAEFGYQNAGLTHQLSLPNSFTNLGPTERFLQIQGSVPCKIRAKRGFATHPRSIAERVRRTRISERIKKLQELFPKSDKQTSTADMLDLAVDYIKDLQQQVKVLTDSRAKCRCSTIQKQYS